MDGHPALARIAAALAPLEPQRTEIVGRPTVIARTSEFRWRWFATRLHTFILVTDLTDSPPSRADLDHLLRIGVDHAREHKGGLPRGLQTGSAAIVAALLAGPTPDSDAWSDKVRGRQFAAMPFPVAVDVHSRTIRYPARMVVGGIYAAHLREVADRYLRDPLAD